MKLFKDKNTVTIGKEQFVEAWMRSAYTAGIPPTFSAEQLAKFEILLGISFADALVAICERLSTADLTLGMGEK